MVFSYLPLFLTYDFWLQLSFELGLAAVVGACRPRELHSNLAATVGRSFSLLTVSNHTRCSGQQIFRCCFVRRQSSFNGFGRSLCFIRMQLFPEQIIMVLTTWFRRLFFCCNCCCYCCYSMCLHSRGLNNNTWLHNDYNNNKTTVICRQMLFFSLLFYSTAQSRKSECIKNSAFENALESQSHIHTSVWCSVICFGLSLVFAFYSLLFKVDLWPFVVLRRMNKRNFSNEQKKIENQMLNKNLKRIKKCSSVCVFSSSAGWFIRLQSIC